MAKKVTRKYYFTIRSLIDNGRAVHHFPTHKEAKRSKIRHACYHEIADAAGLSYETVQRIGRSKSYPDFERLQTPNAKRHIKVVRAGLASVQMIETRKNATVGDVLRLEAQIRYLTDELTTLQTEMAAVKAKKARWFK